MLAFAVTTRMFAFTIFTMAATAAAAAAAAASLAMTLTVTLAMIKIGSSQRRTTAGYNMESDQKASSYRLRDDVGLHIQLDQPFDQ